MSRPTWLAAGVALGVAGTLWAEQRVRRRVSAVVDRLAPEQVASEAVASVRRAGDRVRGAIDAGRDARAHEEAALLGEFDPGAAPRPPGPGRDAVGPRGTDAHDPRRSRTARRGGSGHR